MSDNYKKAREAAERFISFHSVESSQAFVRNLAESRSTGDARAQREDLDVLSKIFNIMDYAYTSRQIYDKTTGWPTNPFVDDLDQDAPAFYFAPFIEQNPSLVTYPVRIIDLQFPHLARLILRNHESDDNAPVNASMARLDPKRQFPNVCLIQVRENYYTYGSSDESIFETFFNLIPPIEWNRCTSYLNVDFIFPFRGELTQRGTDRAGDRGNSDTRSYTIAPRVSSLRFLEGTSQLQTTANAGQPFQSPDYALATYTNSEIGDQYRTARENQIDNQIESDFQDSQSDLARRAREFLNNKFSSSGMELFTSPQTMIPKWERYSSFDEVANFRDIITPTRIDTTRSNGRNFDLVADNTGGEAQYDDFPMTYPGNHGSHRLAPVIDRNRPFLTLTSVNIDDVATGHGEITRRVAELKMVLHDRSRIGEISDIISHLNGDKRALINIEWGWSHPEASQPESTNHAAKFINSLRSKQVFEPTTCSYNFTDDGQVNITLKCNTVGAARAEDYPMTRLNSSLEEDFKTLKDLSQQVRRLTEEAQRNDAASFASLTNHEVITNLGRANGVATLFNEEERNKIYAFLQNLDTSPANLSELRQTLQQIKDRLEAQEGSAGALYENSTVRNNTRTYTSTSRITNFINDAFQRIQHDLNKSVEYVQQSRAATASEAAASAAVRMHAGRESVWWALTPGVQTGTSRLNTALATVRGWAHHGCCSFGQLAATFIGGSLHEAKAADEIQLIFYNLSDKCSWMSGLNIANFPIKIEGDDGIKQLWRSYRQSNPEVTIAKFMLMMNTMFFRNQATQAYGFSDIMKRDENGQATRITLDDNPRSRRQQLVAVAQLSTGSLQPNEIQEAQATALRLSANQVHGRTADQLSADRATFFSQQQTRHYDAVLAASQPNQPRSFRAPHIKLFFESVMSQTMLDNNGNESNPSKNILRVHIYDQHAVKYSSMADVRSATERTNINRVGNLINRARIIADRGPRTTQQQVAMERSFAEKTYPNIFERVNDQSGRDSSQLYLRVRGGAAAIKRLIKESMPSITLGTQASLINGFNINTLSAGNAQSAAIGRNHRNRSRGTESPTSAQKIDIGLPMQYLPMKASFKTFGCPFLRTGQELFIDAGTGSTADNIYRVAKVGHTISAGEFTTDVELRLVDAYGIYRSPIERLNSVTADLMEWQQSPPSTTSPVIDNESYDVPAPPRSELVSGPITPGLIHRGAPNERGAAYHRLHPSHPLRIRQILSRPYSDPSNRDSENTDVIPNRDDENYWRSTAELRVRARTTVLHRTGQRRLSGDGEQQNEDSLYYKIYGPDPPQESMTYRQAHDPNYRSTALGEGLGQQNRGAADASVRRWNTPASANAPANAGPGSNSD